MACVLLLVDLLVKDQRRTVTFALTQLTLVGCFIIQFATSNGQIAYTFSNMFSGRPDGRPAEALPLHDGHHGSVLFPRLHHRTGAMNKGEYYILALFATLGMMVMISANHFLTVYLGLELLSLSLYAMVAMNRDSVVSTEAAMNISSRRLASGLLLYGMSMIYGATGTLEITGVAERIAMGRREQDRSRLRPGLPGRRPGLQARRRAFPHVDSRRSPRRPHGGHPVHRLRSPKLAAFAITMRMLVNGLLALAVDWQAMLIILAVLSMAIGNLAAIAQTNLKRMLAYSAISHMGFMLLGIVSGVVGGRVDPNLVLNAYSSSMFYVVAYVLMSAGSFGMILLLARAGFESDNLEDFLAASTSAALVRRHDADADVLDGGIPFFVGFFAKFAVLQAVVISGYVWLAVVAVAFSLVGAFYYLRVVKLMYFGTSPPTLRRSAPHGHPHPGFRQCPGGGLAWPVPRRPRPSLHLAPGPVALERPADDRSNARSPGRFSWSPP